MTTNKKRVARQQSLRKQFLEKPTYRRLYEQYEDTQEPELLGKLNQEYTKFVNYVSLLSLIQTHVKFKSLHFREQNSSQKQELVSEETMEYALDQKKSSGLELTIPQWDAVLESEDLIQAVSDLTEHQQQILWFLFIEDMPVKQAKAQLNVSQQSISKTKNRALKKIQKQLEEKE